MNQLAAYNMAFYRKAAGLTQEELGVPLGWSVASVSAAERSWDGKRIKKFDADELAAIASALRIPVFALFLPPDDAETSVRYVLSDEGQGNADVLIHVMSLPDPVSPVASAYERRLAAATAAKSPGERAKYVLRRRGPDASSSRARYLPRDHDGTVAELDLPAVVSDLPLFPDDSSSPIWYLPRDHDGAVVELDLPAVVSNLSDLPDLINQHEQLKRSVEDLRALEREYRGKLQDFMLGQLRDLWAPEVREEAERRIEEVRKKAAEGAARASAVLLREDGTYEVLEFGAAGGGDTRAAREPERREDGGSE